MFSATVYIYIFAQTDHKEDIPGIRDLFGNTNSIAIPAGYNIEFSRTRLEMNDSQLKEFVWYLWTRGCFMFKSNLFKYVALVKWAGNNRTFYEMRNPTWSELTGRIEGENSRDGCMLYLSYWDWHCIKGRSFSSSFQKNSEVNDIHNDKTFMVTICKVWRKVGLHFQDHEMKHETETYLQQQTY